MDEAADYRGHNRQAMEQALAGKIGFYADFDRTRQEEVWRLLGRHATAC